MVWKRIDPRLGEKERVVASRVLSPAICFDGLTGREAAGDFAVRRTGPLALPAKAQPPGPRGKAR